VLNIHSPPTPNGSSGYTGTYDGICYVAHFFSDTLVVGQSLGVGDQLWSNDGRFYLAMQGDGNLVVYFRLFNAGGGVSNIPLWASNTGGSPGIKALLIGDGNLAVLDAQGNSPWFASSGKPGWCNNDPNERSCKVESAYTGANVPNARLTMQDDGNLVIYNNTTPLWYTGTSVWTGAQ
jgi:hypothetical protein